MSAPATPAQAQSTPASTASSRTSTPGPGGKDDPKDLAKDGKTPDDSSKLRTFHSILKRFIGVTDIAAVRFSLPAQLLEPRPNLGMSTAGAGWDTSDGQQSTGTTSTGQTRSSGQHLPGPMAARLTHTASATRKRTWGACSAACASGSPRTW